MESTVANRQTVGDRRNKFSLSYFVWFVLLFLLFAAGSDLDRIFNLYLFLVPILVLPALVVAICWIVALVSNMWLRRWRRVISVLAAPVAAFVLFVGASALGINASWVRFQLGKQYYTEETAKLAKGDSPRFKTFDWGQTGGAGVSNVFYTLAYDESDEIALPPEKRSQAWQERVKNACPGRCTLLKPSSEISVTVGRIEGHFYLVTEVF